MRIGQRIVIADIAEYLKAKGELGLAQTLQHLLGPVRHRWVYREDESAFDRVTQYDPRRWKNKKFRGKIKWHGYAASAREATVMAGRLRQVHHKRSTT